jgi:Ca-activated chloride channel homolog
MRELIEKLESPAVTGLTASYSGGAMDATPAVLPDLYRGEPVVMAARLATGEHDGTLEIKGKIGARPWSVTLPVAKAAEGSGLSKQWARRKISDAELARHFNQLSSTDTDARVLALALEHHLVSRLTSLVAIDVTPSRPEGARLTRAELPLNLPAGWEFDRVFGPGPHGRAASPSIERASPSAPLERRADAGVRVLFQNVATASTSGGGSSGVALPKTATDAELKMLAGLALLMLAVLLMICRRTPHLSAQ